MICNVTEIKEYNILLDNIFGKISFLRSEYPDFYNWYHNTVLNGLSNGTRKIFIAKTTFSFEKINAILIIKNTKEEKKICTLYVDKETRFMSFGKKLMDIAMNEFNSEKPLITVSENNIDMFRPFLAKYDFEEKDALLNYYKNGKVEYTFNGHLYLPENIKYA